MALPATDKLAAVVERRRELRAGVATSEGRARHIEALVVTETYHPANAAYRGRKIGDLAVDAGRDPVDVLCDIALADRLRTGFAPQPQADDEGARAARVATWTDPRVIFRAS